MVHEAKRLSYHKIAPLYCGYISSSHAINMSAISIVYYIESIKTQSFTKNEMKMISSIKFNDKYIAQPHLKYSQGSVPKVPTTVN